MVSRSIASTHIFLACFMLAGCGSIFIGFSSNQGIPSTVAGNVVSSTLVSINDHSGRPLTVTRVTLSNAGLANSFTFCGDQKVRFPLGATVKVEFTSGIDCLAITDVVVLST
ncbi:MAG TPA: hypothetical protein VHW72_05655 [Candidatus Angelobacter sp.]|nr:hypothetical protein [Candidatus Angelobacter sp.]